MDEEQKQNLKIANRSGFPFQIATAEHVCSWQTPWKPVLIEHPWRLTETATEGYIDIVLQAGQWSSDRLVVECKRRRGDSRWYFFEPTEKTVDVRYLVTRPEQRVAYLQNGQFFPSSARSAFCAMSGEEDGRGPSLERMCDALLQSVEALAEEELRLAPELALFRYIPVIVTTARLFLCNVESLEIPIETGELPEHTSFEETGYVRFEKPLWSKSSGSPAPNVETARRECERTVFVVNGAALRDFLKSARHRE